MVVHFKENEKSHACAHQKSRHHRSRRKQSFQIKLGNNYGCSTIGNQTNHSCCQLSNHRSIQHKRRKGILSDICDYQIQDKADDQNISKNLQGMFQCGREDSLLITVAMFVFTHMMNVRQMMRIFHVCPAQKLLVYKVNDKSGNHADCNFHKQYFQNQKKGHLLRNQNGQHLVRGREIYGNECTQGNHSAGIKVGRCRRKSALGNHSQQRTIEGSELAGTLYKPVGLVTGFMFQIFHRQIGQK